jgi:hypothetical protein
MQLDVSSYEADVLEELLDTALGDLREQIYKTEVADYKTNLKEREAAVIRLLERVRALRARSSTPT